MKKNPFRKIIVFTALSLFLSPFFLLPPSSYADKLKLQNKEEGNEVEILEEKEAAFIVKIPKDEIKVIKREKPTDVKLWKEKKILWEDLGDYISISLPKEKIVSPGTLEPEYKRSETLSDALKETGIKGTALRTSMLTGALSGRITQGGTPLADCRVKLVNVASAGFNLTKFLEKGEGAKPGKAGEYEAVTDADGNYKFEDVPIGDYDIYWVPPGSGYWVHKLSEKPAVTIKAGQTASYPDINL